MDKILLTNLRNLYLPDGGIPEKGKEYLVEVRCERRKAEVDESDPDLEYTTFKMECLGVQGMRELGSGRKLNISKPGSMAQKLRMTIMDVARIQGKNEEECYKQEMSNLIKIYQNKLER